MNFNLIVILVFILVICLFSSPQTGGGEKTNEQCQYYSPFLCNQQPTCNYDYANNYCVNISYDPQTAFFSQQPLNYICHTCR